MSFILHWIRIKQSRKRIEEADFEREVRMLRESRNFWRFLDQRPRKGRGISLDSIDQELKTTD